MNEAGSTLAMLDDEYAYIHASCARFEMCKASVRNC
jgi:hypothetical protein